MPRPVPARPGSPLTAAPAGAADARSAADPLTPADHDLLRRCAAARRPIRRAARVARGSAISILVIAAAGVPLLVFSPSVGGLVMVAGIGAIGCCELVGSRRMRRGEPGAARLLALNQAVFLVLIVGYCLSRIVLLSRAGVAGMLGAEAARQLAELQAAGVDLGAELEGLTRLLTFTFYGLVALVSVAAQGGLALYYLSRRRHLLAWRAGTPAWVQRVLATIES